MASMRPEFNNNITLMQALAPVAYLGNIQSPLIPFVKGLLQINTIKTFELLPHTYTLYKICSASKIIEQYCLNLAYRFLGPDNNSFNQVYSKI